MISWLLPQALSYVEYCSQVALTVEFATVYSKIYWFHYPIEINGSSNTWIFAWALIAMYTAIYIT